MRPGSLPRYPSLTHTVPTSLRISCLCLAPCSGLKWHHILSGRTQPLTFQPETSQQTQMPVLLQDTNACLVSRTSGYSTCKYSGLFPLRKTAELLQVTTEQEKYSVCRGQAPWTAPPVQHWGEKGTQKSDLLPCSS